MNNQSIPRPIRESFLEHGITNLEYACVAKSKHFQAAGKPTRLAMAGGR